MNDKMKFGVITLFIILIQSCLKIIGVLITNSLSFLSETIDTLVDIVFISITLYFLYQSGKPADHEHMYGHSKIDEIGALIQSVILIAIYMFLVFNALRTLLTGVFEIKNPETGMIFLIISFMINMAYSRILIWQGKKNRSLSLELQGLNLFQDSLRALLVLASFILSLVGITFMDPIISIILSGWIIVGALKLLRGGINALMDVNPVNQYIMEQFRREIFNLKHVNGIQDIKLRVIKNRLFIEIVLFVEDHISVARANEINLAIKAIGKRLFPAHELEMIIEMNPLGSELIYKDNLMNIVYSLKPEYPEITELKECNLFSFKDKLFFSFTIVMIPNLSLQQAHDISTRFERDIKKLAPELTRIITHIEPQIEHVEKGMEPVDFALKDKEKKLELKAEIEEILKKYEAIRGYHGLEFWKTLDHLILEIHVFFDGSLNIFQVHNLVSRLELEIKERLNLEKSLEVIIHSEPIIGRTNGTIFKNKQERNKKL